MHATLLLYFKMDVDIIPLWTPSHCGHREPSWRMGGATLKSRSDPHVCLGNRCLLGKQLSVEETVGRVMRTVTVLS